MIVIQIIVILVKQRKIENFLKQRKETLNISFQNKDVDKLYRRCFLTNIIVCDFFKGHQF